MLHPEKNVRQSMMTSKHNNNFSTKGPQTTLNVGIVSNSTKHIASTVAAPEINNAVVQQNGPSSLPSGPKNGKRAGVVIVTDKDHKENGKRGISISIYFIDTSWMLNLHLIRTKNFIN